MGRITNWTKALPPVCFWYVHNSMNFCMPELFFVLYITPRYTTLEYSGHVVMVRVSMKNDKIRKDPHWRIIKINGFFSGVHACINVADARTNKDVYVMLVSASAPLTHAWTPEKKRFILDWTVLIFEPQ